MALHCYKNVFRYLDIFKLKHELGSRFSKPSVVSLNNLFYFIPHYIKKITPSPKIKYNPYYESLFYMD